MTSKEKWRRILRRRALRLAESDKKRFDQKIVHCLRKFIRKKNPNMVFAFAPTLSEPNLWPLYRSLNTAGIKAGFPRVKGRSLLYYITRGRRSFRKGAFGILEPGGGRRARRPQKGDIVLVPCLGLSGCGHRLGHGGGFFDRWLKRNPKALRVGVLFHCQLARRIPHGRHDEQVHHAVTERGLTSFLVVIPAFAEMTQSAE